MTSFALITEGITDQVALESILSGHYDEEPEFIQIQPTRDETDISRQGTFAGWEQVLDCCSSTSFGDIFSTNDFVIIQIDTDICEHENVKIPLTKGGKDVSTKDLIGSVRNFIISKIDADVFQKAGERILFAICVHSLECWLLPLVESRVTRRTKNCESHLQRVTLKANENFEKTYHCYAKLSKPFEKKRNLEHACRSNESLEIFLNSLPAANRT